MGQYTLVFEVKGATMSNCDVDCLKAACPFLALHNRRKVQIIEKSKVLGAMQQLLHQEDLPREYGGNGAPWPEPAEALCLEEQVGELAAAVYRRAEVVPDG